MLSTCDKVAKSSTSTLLVGLVLCAAACGSSKTAAPSPDGGGSDVTNPVARKLLVLHTNDLHSHFMGQAPEADYTPGSANDDVTMGGLARLATAIGTARTAAAASQLPVLLLDGGDFMMGTLFEFAAATDAPELKFMQALGYDATTIGNHELDWTPQGLALILKAAKDGGVTLPILSSNMSFSDASAADDSLKVFQDMGFIRTKLIKTVGGLKVGLFGLLGKDAVQVTPQAAPLAFEPIADAATRMVKELREQDKVDLVIALSHSGIDSMGKGEDADLAARVPGIDIIISGHTHDKLAAPKVVAGTNTVIVTAGSYGRNLGHLELTVTPAATAGASGTVTVDRYTLQDIDDTAVGDPVVQGQVDGIIGKLDLALAPLGASYKQVVARTDGDLALPAYAEAPVGNLVTDAYRSVGATLQPDAPPQVAVEGNGQLRAPILKGTTGQIWFADLFRVTPIGIGPDQLPGYPLVTFYLNAKDIQSGLELGGAPDVVADQYFLQLSGVKVEYDMTRPQFGRVASLKLVTPTGDQVMDVTNTTQCYKVIATSYVAGLLGVVRTFTQGLLSVVAKEADCVTPIDPTTRFVDRDPATPGVQELKQWQAILSYVSALPRDPAHPTDPPIVPAAYQSPQGRITRR